jgi:hypothetical protein
MEMVPTACEAKWNEVHESFERQHSSLLENHPDAARETKNPRSHY